MLCLSPKVVIFLQSFCNLGTNARSISKQAFLHNIYWWMKLISQLERSFYASSEEISILPGLESTRSQVYPKRQRRMVSAENPNPSKTEDVMSLLLVYAISWSSLAQLRCTADTKCSPSPLTMDDSSAICFFPYCLQHDAAPNPSFLLPLLLR